MPNDASDPFGPFYDDHDPEWGCPCGKVLVPCPGCGEPSCPDCDADYGPECKFSQPINLQKRALTGQAANFPLPGDDDHISAFDGTLADGLDDEETNESLDREAR